MKLVKRQIREGPFDFSGYVLLDGIDPRLKPSDVWNALCLDPCVAEERRCLTYTNVLVPKLCAIVKFYDEEDAQLVIDTYRHAPPLSGLRGLNAAACLRALSYLERALGRMRSVCETHVMLENFENVEGGARDLITSAMSRFGEISSVVVNEMENLRVSGGVNFKYYSSALASQIAYHGTVIRGGIVSVVPYRERDEAISRLLEKARQRLSPEQKVLLEDDLFRTLF